MSCFLVQVYAPTSIWSTKMRWTWGNLVDGKDLIQLRFSWELLFWLLNLERRYEGALSIGSQLAFFRNLNLILWSSFFILFIILKWLIYSHKRQERRDNMSHCKLDLAFLIISFFSRFGLYLVFFKVCFWLSDGESIQNFCMQSRCSCPLNYFLDPSNFNAGFFLGKFFLNWVFHLSNVLWQALRFKNRAYGSVILIL